MRKRTLITVAIAAAVLIVAGGLYASNMGFKLNYHLGGPGELGASDTGQNTLGLPYFRQTGIDTAAQLEADIGAVQVTSISRFNRANNSLFTYPTSGNFNLVAGEGYRIQMSAGVNYIVVGSHDPGLTVTLKGPGTDGPNDTGQNDFAPPYHTTAVNAAQLEAQIGAAQVTSISRFNRANNSLFTYPTSGNFNLVPGESYRIQMSSTVPHVPAHY